MSSLILLAETGSDITPAIAARYGIRMVPMHVTFDTETRDDGTFPPEEIRDYYRRTGKLPTTSGSTPEDFARVFDAIHAEDPEAQILYLAYSAVTTCSYQSAVIAAEGRDYITMVDTKQVSVGQCAAVVAMAELLEQNPGMSVSEAAKAAEEISGRVQMGFLPENLEFLKAGGRVSNAAYLGSRILSLHPCIEILDGKLMATKKYRGKMEKVTLELVEDYAEKYALDRDLLWFIYTVDLPEAILDRAEERAKALGFREIRRVRANGVITTHGGPGAFGVAGYKKA